MKKLNVVFILLMIIVCMSVVVGNNNNIIHIKEYDVENEGVYINDPIRAKTATFTEDFSDSTDINRSTTAYVDYTQNQVRLPHREPMYQSTYETSVYKAEIVGNFAYLVNGTGLEIVDISDPSNPSLESFGSCSTGAEKLVVAGSYAYVSDGFSEIYIFDISDPTNPTKEYDSTIASPTLDTFYHEDFYVIGDYLYTVFDQDSHGLEIYDDATDPVNFDDNEGDGPNATFDWYPSGQDNGHALIIEPYSPYPGKVHVAESCGAGLGYQQIFLDDSASGVPDPKQRITGGEIMNCSVAGTPTHIWVNTTDSSPDTYAYLTSYDYMNIVEATIGQVASVANISSPSGYDFMGLTEYNDIAYVAAYNAGIGPDSNLFLYDVADPANSKFILDTMYGFNGTAYDVSYADGYLYVSTRDAGLHIFKDLGYTAYTTEYIPSASIISKEVGNSYTNENIINATLTATDNIASGTSINYYLSADNGKHWESITPGTSHTFSYHADSEYDYLKWKAELIGASDNKSTPTIDSVSIEYFTQVTTPPTLYSPANNTVTSDVTPMFNWSRIIGCSDHQLQLDTVTTFDSANLRVHNITNYESTYTIQSGSELSETTWYWRVAGLDSAGDIGYWSDLGVVYIDLTNPTIDSPADVQYAEDTTGHSITWHPSDPHPAYYNITRNGVDVQNGDWNGSSITIDIDGLAYGSYTYVCTVYDGSEHYVSNEVLVSVYDAENPVIDSPTNQTIEQGTNTTLTWNPADNNPDWYNVTRNGTLMDEGSWDGSSVSYTTDSDLTYGHYVYQCFVYDVDGNAAFDTVGITIQDTLPPSFGTTEDLTYEKGSTGNEIVWYPSDLNPWYYNITLDGVYIDNGLWYGGPISINVDGHDLGSYNYSCFVTDIFDLTSKDTVNVTVIDTTAPIIQDPSDVSFENATTGRPSITWVTSDASPYWYNITRNGTLLEEGNWDGSDLTIDLDDYDFVAAIYIFNCTVYDTEGNHASSTVEVEVYLLPPELDHPADLRFPINSTGYWINWTATDVSPDTYTIYHNGTPVDTGTWQSGIPITYSLDSLELAEGTHNMTIQVTDTNGLQTSDLVWVEIANWPQIIQYTGNTTVGINEPFIIYWNMTDDNPVLSEAYLNGSFIDDQTWTSNDWPYNGTLWVEYASGLPNPGIYNITITVEDNDGLVSADTVWVTVKDMEPPSIDSPADITYNEGEIDNIITWHPSDTYPKSYGILRNGTVIESGAWDGSSISVNVDDLAAGVYIFNCTVYDEGDNTASDIVEVQVYPVPPEIDHPADLGFPQGTTGHWINWTATDTSPNTYTIYYNGTSVDTGTWQSDIPITYNLDSLVLSEGVYNFTIVVTDTDELQNSDLVWVVVADWPQITQYTGNTTVGINEPFTIYWNMTDDNPVLYEAYLNGTFIDDRTWTSDDWPYDGTLWVEYASGLPNPGIYNITITVEDDDGLISVDTVWVTVKDMDPPTITLPSDITYTEGDTGYQITWYPDDDYPASYVILKNGTIIESGAWDGSSISINVDGLTPAVYEYNCTVLDEEGNAISDVVKVHVLGTMIPELEVPDNLSVQVEDPYGFICNITDDGSVSWYLYKNGSQQDSGFLGEAHAESIYYNDESGISYLSTYNWTLYVLDNHGNEVLATFWVTMVDTVAPTLESTSGSYFEFNYGASDVYVDFTVQDALPATYEVEVDGDLFSQGDWSSGYTISIEVTNLTIGEHNAMFIFYDTSDNSVSHTMTINVKDTSAPTINGPNEIAILQGEAQTITWQCNDNAPATYSINIGTNLVETGSWNGSNINYAIPTDLEPGEYHIRCEITDEGGNQVGHTVIVTVNQAIAVDSPDDQTVNDEYTGQIIWSPYGDPPCDYEIYMDGELQDSGTWTDGSISYSFGPLSEGDYKVEIVLTHPNGKSASDVVWIYVESSETGEFSPSFLLPLTLFGFIALVGARRKKKLE